MARRPAIKVKVISNIMMAMMATWDLDSLLPATTHPTSMDIINPTFQKLNK